jgi:hypothetical protein
MTREKGFQNLVSIYLGEFGTYLLVQMMKFRLSVMITIFCDFPQFSAKKLAFF